ncbi:rod-binding protein [Parvibaculum sp.]|jgi:Rod binding domain-containing protein|uniref:rod-binding protein n=1 Tax=Parvibaculum sp. TaxID=2024848 RepID=UPI001B2D91D0|nr:rod-binding protein [Parvibaculum sp.]MBO6634689.1 rod-binding protein [Parvibaculum sp.]MBO6679887.1 rod-binding protein [Parvibaculum sp.]MBO6684357.1 rod-binding protein [Parvibaculum sp.]MBO6903647.1 rod-binding protein [Parvibaculum sp.]
MDALAAPLPVFMHLPAGQSAAAQGPAKDVGRDPRAWEAAQDFEAQFVSSMFQSMFEGVSDDNPFGGGPGESMFRSVLVDQYGRQVAKSGGVGIADDIYREILKMQEVSQ